MNVAIEVAAAEAFVLLADPTVVAVKRSPFFTVVTLTSAVATSVLRSLISQGRTSLSAVSPDFTFEGGLAVA